MARCLYGLHFLNLWTDWTQKCSQYLDYYPFLPSKWNHVMISTIYRSLLGISNKIVLMQSLIIVSKKLSGRWSVIDRSWWNGILIAHSWIGFRSILSTFCQQKFVNSKQLVRNMLHADYQHSSQIAKLMGPTWGRPGSCRSPMGPMLAPWTLLSVRGIGRVYRLEVA